MRLREALALPAVMLGVAVSPATVGWAAGPASASAPAALAAGHAPSGWAAGPASASARSAASAAVPGLAADSGAGPPGAGGAQAGGAVGGPVPGVGPQVGPGVGSRPAPGVGPQAAPALPSLARADCGDGKSTAFPIGARIRGGPAVYRTGGDPQTWYLDLSNTTAAPCTAVHPVVVFTDKTRALRPEHFRMEFQTPSGAQPVSLERTDRDEIIAVFDGGRGFPGFAVAPGGSITVKVALAFADGAPTGEVVADAAIVHRKGDDGDWVGEAGGYRFDVEGPGDPAWRYGEAGALAETGARHRPAAPLAAVALAAGLVGGGLALRARARRLPLR
ncbi:hypothetical protein [Streptomyces sp. NPDC012888]|uniref:hypothetical protein n=1 Tax=Streptomyces sp. NPDC012888 TaxID=3364855 RepID=UPI0036796BE9